MRHGWRRRCNPILFNAWVKYGEASFRFDVLELCEPDRLTEREEYWLREFRDVHGFRVANHAGPCENPMRGAKHRPESIAKMAQFQKGRKKTPEHRAKIGAAHLGRRHTPDSIEMMRAAKIGKPNRYWLEHGNPNTKPERIERMRVDNPIHRPGVVEKIAQKNRRAVLDPDSSERWASMSACAEALGVSVARVSFALANDRAVRGRTLARA